MTHRDLLRNLVVVGTTALVVGLGFQCGVGSRSGVGSPSDVEAQSFSGVLTWHNDVERTGQNLSETILTPANVNATQFGKRFSYAVDGQIYAQPLYVPNVSVPGQGIHNVVYVATEHDSVYAFDGDGLVSKPLWHTSFINPASVTTMLCTDPSQPDCNPTIITPERGITATPVIDPVRGNIYVIAKTVENGTYTLKLYALDITTGSERLGSPVVIHATAPGHPDVAFSGLTELDRSALLLLNGVVYIGFNSDDSDRGWLIGYDESTLAQTAAFCVTPTGNLGSIWGSGAGPAADSEGNIYFMTGNGTFDANKGGEDYAMTMLKLIPSGSMLNVADYFTPFDEAMLSDQDLDLASGGVLVLPNQPGAHPDEIIGGSKTGQVFLVDRNNMGKFDETKNNVIQTLNPAPEGIYSSPAYWNGHIYFSGVHDNLKLFDLNNGLLVNPPASQSSATFGYPGTTPSISVNGSTNAIAWIIEVPQGSPQNNPPAVLHAYDATNLANELYNSNQAGTRDQARKAIKMTVPTIANGKVYVGTQTELDAYGLLH
jgi:hypothetical protein